MPDEHVLVVRQQCRSKEKRRRREAADVVSWGSGLHAPQQHTLVVQLQCQ
jgi:hypothetical protein